MQKAGCQNARDFAQLLDAIEKQTGISISLDGVYRWVAFLPSKHDARVPVPNRYFGVFQDGEIKYRGIELRRHDTPSWVAKTQLAVLQCLAQAKTLEQVRDLIPQAHKIVEQAKRDLRTGRVPLDDLLISLRLSRNVDAYKSPSPAARAARQLVKMGRTVAPGQSMQFIYTLGKPGVWAYGSNKFNEKTLDVEQYIRLLQRATMTVLEPFLQKEHRNPSAADCPPMLPVPHLPLRLKRAIPQESTREAVKTI